MENVSYQSDDQILCDDCDKLYQGQCPDHGPLEWIKTSRAIDSDHYSPSVASLPDGLVLKESGIPDNDMGVFAARLIYKRTMFGPYEGAKIPSNEVPKGRDLTYAWDILQNGISSYVLDGADEKQSNWTRYITYARDRREQNLIAFQYKGEIFYRTFRDVYPGEELMVWYEDEYSCSLDDLPQEFPQDQEPEFACQRCRLVFAGTTYIYKHRKFRCPDGPLAGTYGARTTGLVGALFRLPVAIANDTWSSTVPNNECKPKSDESHHSRRKRKPRKLPRPSETEEAWNPEQPFGPPPITELNHNEADLNQTRTTMVMLPPEAQALDAPPDFIMNNDDVIEPDDSAYEDYIRRLSAQEISDHQEKRQRIDGEMCAEEEESKYPYRCNECGKSFARPVWWAKHESGCRKKKAKMKNNTANNSITPPRIIESPSSIAQTNRPKQVKPRKEPYKCGYCDKRFACPSWMRRHERVHTKYLKTNSIPQAPMKPESTEEDSTLPYKCVDCGRRFAVAAWLTRHRTTVHPNSKAQTVKPLSQPRGHVCRDCGRSFAVAAWLTRHRMVAHKNIVTKKHSCGVCGRSFAVAFWLTRHMKIHGGTEKTKKSSSPATSKPVNATPTESRKESTPALPWVCGQCGISFKFESWLKRHQKNNKHGAGFYQTPKEPEPEPLLMCEREGCGKSFKTKRLLGRHRRRHLKKDKANDLTVTVPPVQPQATATTSFICQHPNCGKSFSTKRMLTRHTQKHVKTEESKINTEAAIESSECHVCNKVFSTKDLLNRHIKRIHGKEFLTTVKAEVKAAADESETQTVAKSGTKSGHACKFCNKVFSYPLLLQRHLKRHRKNEKIRKNLTKALNLPQDASPQGSQNQTYVCEICNASFKGLHILNKHMEKHLGEERSSLKKSASKVTKPDPKYPFQCDQCGRKFAVAFWLTRHKNEHKKDNETTVTSAPKVKSSKTIDPKLPFQCKECGRSFAVAFWLTRHMREHKKEEEAAPPSAPSSAKPSKVNNPKLPFKCEECGREFAVAFWLTRHKREHANSSSTEKELDDFKPVAVTKGNSKVYVCDICDREFIWPSWLVKHRRVHKSTCTETKKVEHPVKEKPAKKEKESTVKKTTPGSVDDTTKASSCFEMFDDNGVKQYRCTICGKTTVWHTGIVYHIRVHHTKEKPFKCRVCGKDFHMAGDLTKHARRHSGEKPYYCQHCKKRFPTSQQARKHAAIHSSELPFHCKHCGKRYRDRSSVWRHLAKKSCPGSQESAPTTSKAQSEEQHPTKRSVVGKDNVISKRKQEKENRAQKKPVAESAKSSSKNAANQKTSQIKKTTHVCKNCNKSFAKLDAFKAHIEAYVKAGQIVCEFCGKCWARSADLTRHRRVHTGERPYLCPDCGLAFKVSDALKRHMMKLHPKSTKSIIRIKSEPSNTSADNLLNSEPAAGKEVRKILPTDSKDQSVPGGRKRAQEKEPAIKDSNGNIQSDSGTQCSEGTEEQEKHASPQHAAEHEELNESASNAEKSEPNRGEDDLLSNCAGQPQNESVAKSDSDGDENGGTSRVDESVSDVSPEHVEVDTKELPSETTITSNEERDEKDQHENGLSHPLEGLPEENPTDPSAEKENEEIHTCQHDVNSDNNQDLAKKEQSEEPQDRNKKKRPGKNKGHRCEFCGKVLTAAGNLARHVRLHTGEKPFTCKDCGESFMRTDILSQHALKFHASSP